LSLPFKVAAVVLCDDIRQEQNNKHILIGVYNGTIVVQEFPAQFQLSWWIQIFPTETGQFHLDIQLTKDERDILLRAGVGYDIREMDWASMVLPRISLQFHGPGKMQLQMKQKSESEWIIIQDFDVRRGTVITALPSISHVFA
jgi:hypothetical protein